MRGSEVEQQERGREMEEGEEEEVEGKKTKEGVPGEGRRIEEKQEDAVEGSLEALTVMCLECTGDASSSTPDLVTRPQAG